MNNQLGRLGLVIGLICSNTLILLEVNGGTDPVAMIGLITLSLLGFGLYVLSPNHGG